ncbi:probable protein S-acyltransferase 6 [Lycium barbarum]|uniref:probable protein S-acyltransferase 6 n=1 Tax=Lycium barbarum TaxID=112863 RepID=UPI00293F5145|nr:probable protein S-acyltransferase 6 [Lycium barbarum]
MWLPCRNLLKKSAEVAQVDAVIEIVESQNLSLEEVEIDFLAKIKKMLFNLWRNVVGTRTLNEDNVTQNSPGDRTKRVRLYHVWPGKNVFFLKGLLICGPDPRRLLLTIVSISLSSLVFSVYVAKDIKYSSIIVSFCLLLTLIVFANLIIVSVIDPGIIPRNDELPSPESTKNGRIRSKRVIIDGLELKLKYCRSCNIYRPPRSCHCVVCDNCVEKFDHHCPWIGQCIGLRNYRLYVLLLVMATIYFVYIFAFACLRMHHQKNVGNGMGLIGLVRDCPETLVLACFSFASSCFVSGLTCYHVYLIATNQTAYENFRQLYGSTKIPFDKGVVNNIKEVLLAPWRPSRINFRSEICGTDHTEYVIEH